MPRAKKNSTDEPKKEPEADGYYTDQGLGDDELDVSFLDDEKEEE
jgi:hypothetical protein